MKNIISTITLGLVLAGCASHEDAPVVPPTETPAPPVDDSTGSKPDIDVGGTVKPAKV
jgi:PBP1b-binding outer membrane lipoprotein LpoB